VLLHDIYVRWLMKNEAFLANNNVRRLTTVVIGKQENSS